MKDSHRPHPPCVFPAATEMDIATIAGANGESAIRVRVEPNNAGYVRLEQMAHSADLGWYCQKSFVIPGVLVRELITQLRKADCFLPRTTVARNPLDALPFRLTEPLPQDEADEAQRRDA